LWRVCGDLNSWARPLNLYEFLLFFVVFSCIKWIMAHCLLGRQYVIFLELTMGSNDYSELKLSETKKDASEDLRAIKKVLKKTKQHISPTRNHFLTPILDDFSKSPKENLLSKDVPVEDRIKLAIKALNLGGEPTEVCGLLDWREFEQLSLKAFQLNGYEATKGFTFSSKKRRFQIDILAIKSKTMLCVDCKHWMFSHWFSNLKEATKAHLCRTEAFAKDIDLLTKKLSFKISKKIFIIPVMLTLGDPRSRIIEDVPIVSVLKLRNFLYELPYPPDAGLKYYIT
jgi:hypothetical protein